MDTTSKPAGTLEEVLAFWFAPGREAEWFAGSEAFDAAVRAALGPLQQAAAAGELDAWAETPRGSLVLVILLDQVPRQLYRGQAAAFACDAAARRIAAAAVERGFDRQLETAERFFLYLPFEHSEELGHQHVAVSLIGALGREEWTGYAERHREIIERFGRFPHRNAALGRSTTEAEAAFLLEPGSSF